MKKQIKKGKMEMRKSIAILLTLALIFSMAPVSAFAAETDQFSDMPDNWSTEALKNTISNGLLKGDNGKIMPDANLTRAQMAAIINRAFGSTKKASLSSYKDVSAGTWYYDEMAKAVQMKTFIGSGDKLNPNNNITREEAFVVLARAFKLSGASANALNKFSDKASVSQWAKDSVASLAEAGYIAGSNGKVNPKQYITRAEFAQIMDNLLKNYIKKAGTYTTVKTGNVMVNVPNVVLKDIAIKGDLIIGDGVGNGNVTLDGVTVSGRTVIRGGGINSIKIIGNSNLQNIIIARVDGQVRVYSEDGTEIGEVTVDGNDDVIIEGNAGNITVLADNVTVTANNADITSASIVGENTNIIVGTTSTIGSVSINAANSGVEVSGQVNNIQTAANAVGTEITVASGGQVSSIVANGSGTTVGGSGTVRNVTANANNVVVTTTNTSVTAGTGTSGVIAGTTPVTGGTTDNTTSTPTPTTSSGGSSSGSSGSSRDDDDDDDDDVSNIVSVSAISVEPKELTLLVEETAQLTATVTPSNATNKKINWSSSDEEVATVDASGNVTAVAVGTATITATSDADSSKKDSCVVTIEAKEPAFPVLYYTGKDFNRSFAPIVDSSGNVVQTINADGSITITVKDEGYIDSGFVLEAGTLGELGSITVKGTGEYGLNLYFDLNKDGEFFDWDGNNFEGVGADAYALYHGAIEDGVLTVTDATKFNLMGTGGGVHTVAELKAKYDADTKIGIWVGVTSPNGDEKTATISKVIVAEPTPRDITVQSFNQTYIFDSYYKGLNSTFSFGGNDLLEKTVTIKAELYGAENKLLATSVYKDVNSLLNAWKNQQSTGKLLMAVFALDSDGSVIASSVETDTTNFSHRQYFKQAMQGSVSVTAPYISVVTDGYCVTVAVPAKREGQVVGVVFGDVKL
ncbi:MAG: S-layer homology domain-containing protein [Lutisporaceae bacterium]